MRLPFTLDELRFDRDVAVRRPGIRTHLVRHIDQTLRHVRRDAGQADVQADRDVEAVTVRSKVDLCVDREIGRKRELHPASHEFHRRLVAGRPARGEQLLRIGALARGAGLDNLTSSLPSSLRDEPTRPPVVWTLAV